MSTFLAGAAKQLTGNTLRAEVSLNRVSDVPLLLMYLDWYGSTLGTQVEEKKKKEKPGIERKGRAWLEIVRQ